MKFKHGLAFPTSDCYLYDRLPESRIWQQDALELGLMYCQQFRTALDGGAHIGTWSIKLAERFNRVLAFEPAHDTYACLLQNTAGLSVERYNQALGAKPGYAVVQRTVKDIQRMHTGARYCVDADEKNLCNVPRVTIDSLSLTDLDFLKLDLEGGEPDAIKGAAETLARCKPVVVFETGKFEQRFGYAKGESERLLASLGAQPLADAGINRVWGWP